MIILSGLVVGLCCWTGGGAVRVLSRPCGEWPVLYGTLSHSQFARQFRITDADVGSGRGIRQYTDTGAIER